MTYFQDKRRHLVCYPYSEANLHEMADNLRIGRHWFHRGRHPHYDIPKRDFPLPGVTTVSPRTILKITRGEKP